MSDKNDNSLPLLATRHKAQTRLRVLVVDDVRDASDSLAMVLELSGYSVDAAYDGATALTLAEKFQPQAIVIDLMMPKMDGLELVRRFRANPATAKATIVAVTGHSGRKQEQAALAAGFDRFLVKPVSLLKLLEAFGERFSTRGGAAASGAEPDEPAPPD